MIKVGTQENLAFRLFIFPINSEKYHLSGGVCSPVEAGEHTRRLEYERQYSRSDLYCGDSSLRSE